MRIYLLKKKLKESLLLTQLYLTLLLVLGYLAAWTGAKTYAFLKFAQVHRSSRWMSFKKLVEPWLRENLAMHARPRPVEMARDTFIGHFGGRIIVLKPKISDSEPGVILVKYSESLPLLPKFFDMAQLMRDYDLVFEPSWSGYCTQDVLHYTSYNKNVFMLAKESDDFRFLKVLDAGLVPLKLGPCDWVDPGIAEEFLSMPKRWDIVMNSNWGEPKRHEVLFRALSKSVCKYKVALIGFAWHGRTREDIETLARYYGVEEQITFFEKIAFDEVMKINCQSKIAILLSLKEGSNRSIAEALFCDIPAIVLKNHVGGIVENIVPETGELVDEKVLQQAIASMFENYARYSPRQWAIDNISCIQSTKLLNESIKQDVITRGGEWTRDIAVRSNSPDLKYYDGKESDYTEYNQGLKQYLV